MYDAFQYTIDNNGIDKEDSYPYRGKVTPKENTID